MCVFGSVGWSDCEPAFAVVYEWGGCVGGYDYCCCFYCYDYCNHCDDTAAAPD